MPFCKTDPGSASSEKMEENFKRKDNDNSDEEYSFIKETVKDVPVDPKKRRVYVLKLVVTALVFGLRLVLDEDDSPKFRTSETVVTVIVGEERTVELLNGDGSYTVAGGEDYLASSIEAGRLVVSGKNVGTATVQVTDITTGATAVVTVIVKPVEKYTVNGVTFTMVAVEGGAFSLGSSRPLHDLCERLQHRQDRGDPGIVASRHGHQPELLQG